MSDTGADPRLAGTEIVDSVIDTIGEHAPDPTEATQ
jgi:hypothetical protein